MFRDELRISLLVASIALSACASTSPPFTDEACGPRPDQKQIDAAVQIYVAATNWKDPSSVQVRNATLICRARWTGIGAFARNRTVGWEIDIEVNAKNSYGGFTGFEPRSLLPSGQPASTD